MTDSSAAGEDTFVQDIVAHAKQVLVESKRLVDIVNNLISEEEDISAPARDTALATFSLLDYVTRRGGAGRAGAWLTTGCKQVRTAVLDLVQAARSVFANPFDFLSKQTLDNCRNTVVNAIKDVIQAAESIQEAQNGTHETEESEPAGDVVHYVRTVNRALQAILAFSKNPTNQETFLHTAKDLLDGVNNLMLTSKSLGLTLEDKLKENTTGVIHAAKLVMRDFSETSYQSQLHNSIQQLQASLKEFLFACAKSKDTKLMDQVLRARGDTFAPRPMYIRSIFD